MPARVKVFRVINDVSHQDAFQSNMDKLVQWSERWQIRINFTKCKTVYTGRIKNRREYKMNGYKLEGITQEKDLGVVINNTLSASDQVLKVRKRR